MLEKKPNSRVSGILPVNKSLGTTSFSLVKKLRKITSEKKVGHAGTLDPLATGLMIMLIGKKYTRMSNQFLNADKEYIAQVHIGCSTSSLDSETEPSFVSDYVPTLDEIKNALQQFEGTVKQTPPMLSAKKINGQILYKLARQGITILRQPIIVNLHIDLIEYTYPFLKLKITCSKGTYIRVLAQDIGDVLNTGAYLFSLMRTRSGSFSIDRAIDEKALSAEINLANWLIP